MTIVKDLLKNPILIFFFAVVSVMGSVWILLSNGFYYIDECAHYLYSRFVLQALPVTVQTWHRPIPQWLFALPAQLGHTFTMFFALTLYLCLLYCTWRIATLHKIRHAEWAVILTGLQPILFDLSYACMTEIPAALLITLAYLQHQKGNHKWSMTLASTVFLCRTEMFVFSMLMFLVYVLKREWKILPLVLVGPLIWIGSTTIISGDVMTFFREWSSFSNLGKFIPGVSVMHYVINLYTIFGLVQTALFITGAVLITKSKRTLEYGILYGTIFATFVIHTLAGAEIFHWTGSIGELRYIAVVGPFFGIIAVYGLSEILEKMKSQHNRLVFSLIVFTAVVFQCTLATHPRLWANYEKVVITMTHAVKKEYPHITLLSNHCAAAYVMDVSPSGGKYFAPFNMKTMKQYPECLILWDPFSSNSLFFQTELTKEKILQDTTISILDRYTYWNSEYLLLYKNIHRDNNVGDEVLLKQKEQRTILH